MRKNVFIKSMLRQPLRTGLLFVLIALASFTFVARTAEFMIVRRQIDKTGAFYVTRGFISHPELLGDVSPGVDLLGGSGFIGFEDIQRGAEGFLQGMYNTNYGGMPLWMHQHFSARYDATQLNETLFYAYIVHAAGCAFDVTLQVRVDEVLIGHPEYIVPGQLMDLRFSAGGENPSGIFDDFIVGLETLDFLLEDGTPNLPMPRQENLPPGFMVDTRPGREGTRRLLIDWANPPRGFGRNPDGTPFLDGMMPEGRIGMFHGSPIIRNELLLMPPGWQSPLMGFVTHLSHYGEIPRAGERFLFRAIYVHQYPELFTAIFMGYFNPFMPVVWEPGMLGAQINNDLWLWPLGENLWYYPVPTGQSADFSLPELSHIPAEIESIRRDMHAMRLLTTRDMEALRQPWVLSEGRMLTYEDYRRANPVAVINALFARQRDIEVGDFLTFSIPREQSFAEASLLPGFVQPVNRTDRREPHLFDDAYTLTVEVVGLGSVPDFTWDMTWSLYVYIPDSVLPAGIGVIMENGTPVLPDVWYSFVLNDARREREFIYAYQEQILDLGMELVVPLANAEAFWMSADPILLSTTFNAVLFWLVLLLVVALVAFLFIRQRRRDFSIMRSLGISAGRVYLRLFVAIVLLGVPPVLLGGFAGRHVAVNEANEALAVFQAAYDERLEVTEYERLWEMLFGELPPRGTEGFRRALDMDAEITPLLLFMLVLIVFAILLFATLGGSFATLRLPVLEQLQGGRRMYLPRRRMTAEAEINDKQALRVNTPLPLSSVLTASTSFAFSEEKTAPHAPVGASLRFIRRHIFRAPIKAALGLLIALAFLVSLGWLQNTIHQTEAEINYVYDNTLIQAWLEGWATRRAAVYMMRETDFIDSVYLEATFGGAEAHGTSAVFIPDADLVVTPAMMAQGIAIPPEILAASNPTVSTNNIEVFLYRHSLAAGLTPVGFEHRQSLRIDFMDGFTEEDFNHFELSEGAPIPVVVAYSTLAERGLAVGDYAYYGYAFLGTRWREKVPVHIVGVHNGHIHLNGMEAAVIMPIQPFESMLIGLDYIAVLFYIDPAFNRDLSVVRESWVEIISPVIVDDAGAITMPEFALNIDDYDLNITISALRHVLLLLEMLYPVAVTLAVSIGFGLGMLLMLQNALTAAILRVLGTSLHKTRLLLWTEPLILCLIGLAAGLVILFIMGQTLNAVLVLCGLYLAGYTLGSAVGAIFITQKPPLEMLQVRE